MEIPTSKASRILSILVSSWRRTFLESHLTCVRVCLAEHKSLLVKSPSLRVSFLEYSLACSLNTHDYHGSSPFLPCWTPLSLPPKCCAFFCCWLFPTCWATSISPSSYFQHMLKFCVCLAKSYSYHLGHNLIITSSGKTP
jgi:hypothetical protein